MLDLLEAFAPMQIVGVLVLSAAALKGVVDFLEWAHKKIKKKYDKESEADKKYEEIDERLHKGAETFDAIRQNLEQINTNMERMNEQLNDLVASDKDDIKAFIVDKHNFFCYEQLWIDDFSLDCLERRYAHYVKEGGNSYVEGLMKDIRALQHRPH